MSLFQSTVVKKYSNTLDEVKLEAKWKLFTTIFHNKSKQDNIRSSKEEQYQAIFLNDLFVQILEYTQHPNTDYNLITEQKNQTNSKKADGAIIFDSNVHAVIELKGTETTDLSKIETQAFGYKNNQKDCNYVIISNFEKLRFYIDNATEFIEFDLFKLTREEFNLLWICLSFESMKSDLPKKIKNESVSNEDKITKELYKDYSAFRRELFSDIEKLNPQYDRLLLFKKTQKLLDRFLFIFFAEDRQLLPTNLIFSINLEWQKLRESRVPVSLYDRYKMYFQDLNTGARVTLPAFGKHTNEIVTAQYDIYAYNGGLFQPDEVLDTIAINDDLLYKHSKKLSDYDFQSEVDVNILGHIFENSLNEIDEITTAIEGQEVDKAKSKRKKDGVFYTPKYITKYIVDNTIGKLCEEKKVEISLDETKYNTDKKINVSTKKKLKETLDNYRNWLLELTIVDPACGSGAFLNQALEFLIAEHKYVDELQAKLFGDALVLSDVEGSILENNLFGVDLNEESVEIAKLSLWLRTAQRNRKLNSLNNNIKCGNSLIDDVAVAGEKAFNWESEFPQVFANGGFDVVIGNPPYVSLEKIKATSEALEKQKYFTFNKRGDLYCVFVEKGFDISKENGVISYIMPNKWLQAGYGKNLREFFLRYNLIQLIDFGDMQIFEGATTYPSIFISKKSAPERVINISTLDSKIVDFDTNIAINQEAFEHSQLSSDTWVISSNKEKDLIDKLKIKYKTLQDFVDGEAFYGIKFGLTEAYLITDEKRDELIKKDFNSSKIIGSILRGRNLKRYGFPNEIDLDNIILASYGSYKVLENDYPAIHEHISSFETKLKLRGQCNGSKETVEKPFKGQHHWLELDNNPTKKYLDIYKTPKIMYQKFQVKPCFIFDEQGLYCNDSMWIIPTENKALLGILNSKMGWWLITKFCTQIQNGCQLIWKYFGQIPIANTTDALSDLVTIVLSLNKELQEVTSKFNKYFSGQFKIEKLSGKLEKWYTLSFEEFIKEINKVIKVQKGTLLTKKEEFDWIDLFEENKQKANALQNEIAKTDKEIDAMVYQLYELNEEEIKIVEGN